MSRVYRDMRSAPKTGRMILLRIEHPDGKLVRVPGCWMAPCGDKQLIGWWSAGATTGSASYNGLPHNYSPCAVSPLAWKDL